MLENQTTEPIAIETDHLATHANDLKETTTLKFSSLFLLTQPSGEVPPQSHRTGQHALGLYFHDTRYLNEKRMQLNGRPMTLLFDSADLGERGTRELTNAELVMDDGQVLPKESIGLHVDTVLDGEVREVLTFRNFSRTPAEVTLTLAYGSDFDDIFTVRGMPVGARGRLEEPEAGPDSIRLAYVGADRRRRTTQVMFYPVPTHCAGSYATYRLRLEPGVPEHIMVTIAVADTPLDPAVTNVLETTPSRLDDVSAQNDPPLGLATSHVRMTTSNELFNRVLRRSFLDLGLLETNQGDDRFFAAGVPWYVALFGRDSIITALETLPFAPEVGRATLDLLARHQGRSFTPDRDEEPGKILHELRVGERARLGEVPFTPYYGSVDSTPLFLVLLGEYLQWSGDLEYFASVQPHVDAALEWLDRESERDGDGLLQYHAQASNGLANQGWKDSYNAIVNADGSLVEPPVALVELQGYAYRAYRAVANVCRAAGDDAKAEQLSARAAKLRELFEQRFWLPELGNYALALHGSADVGGSGGRASGDGSGGRGSGRRGSRCRGSGGKRAAGVDASNQGQALWGGIVSRERAGAVRDSLMDPERLFAGWGVRTLSQKAVAYNPFDYQTGAIWPHDCAMVAVGLRAYGYDDDALRILTGLYEAATRFELYRLPELFAGFDRDTYGTPVRYPVACSPQAWAAGSLPYLLTSVLGIVPDAFGGRLHVVRPCLPTWLEWVEVRGLALGGSEVDLRFERSGELTLAAATAKSGDVQVMIEY